MSGTLPECRRLVSIGKKHGGSCFTGRKMGEEEMVFSDKNGLA